MTDSASLGLDFIQDSLNQMITPVKEDSIPADLIKEQREFDDINQIRQAAILYGRTHKFAVSTLRSGERQLVLVCKHSGSYRAAKKGSSLKKSPLMTQTNDAQEGEASAPLKGTRKKLSQRIRCPFEIRAKPIGGKWVIYKFVDDHNHEMADDIIVYAQHRKLDQETKQSVMKLIELGYTNSKIIEELTIRGVHNVLSRDISNLRNYYLKKSKKPESTQLLMNEDYVYPTVNEEIEQSNSQ